MITREDLTTKNGDNMELVGGLEYEFYDFPYVGNFIIPTDFHIFQRGSNHQPVEI